MPKGSEERPGELILEAVDALPSGAGRVPRRFLRAHPEFHHELEAFFAGHDLVRSPMFTVNGVGRARRISVVKPPTKKEMAELNSIVRSLVNPNSSVKFDQRSGYWLVGFSQPRSVGWSYQQALHELTDMA
jgi:hypothetical protein